jgi:hypothetical protein
MLIELIRRPTIAADVSNAFVQMLGCTHYLYRQAELAHHFSNSPNISKTTSMREKLTELLTEVFSQRQPRLGCIELFCVGDASGDDRFFAYLDALRVQRRDGTLQSATDFFFTYCGDSTQGKELHRRLSNSSTDACVNDARQGGAAAEVKWTVLPDMQAESFTSSVMQLADGAILVVGHAGRLRFSDVAPYSPSSSEGDYTIALPEDDWVPHLLKLITEISLIAEERNFLVLLDVGYYKPHREALLTKLEEAPANIVFGFPVDGHRAAFQESIQKWPQWIAHGELKPVFDSIEKMSGMNESSRILLRTQVFLRVGLLGHAIEELQKVDGRDGVSSEVLAQLARMAIDCRAPLLARDFLARSLSGLETKEALEAALDVAWRANDAAQETLIAERLEAYFPASAHLARRRIRAACLVQDFAGAAAAAQLLPDGQVEKEGYTFIAQHLSAENIPDYSEINRQIGICGAGWAMQARDAIVRDALRRGLIIHALSVLEQFPNKARATRKGVILSLDTLGQVLMARAPGVDTWVVDPVRLQTILATVIAYLAENPSDAHVHGRLVHLLSVEGSGRFGTPAMLALLAQHMRGGWKVTSAKPDEPVSRHEIQEIEPTLIEGLKWMTQHSPFVFGRTRLPEQFLRGDPLRLMSTIRILIGQLEGDIRDDGDVLAVENWLALGIAVAPYIDKTLQDLRLTNVAAVLLAQNGRQQRARDLCQQVMISAGTDPQRRRLAWSVALSIYKACGGHTECLIASACAMVIDVAVDPQDGWQEANDLTRIFRDAGLYDLAMMSYEMAGSLLDSINAKPRMRVQHTYLGLSVRMKDVAQRLPRSLPELETLLIDTSDLAELVMQGNHSRKPVASMLGQLINLATQLRLPFSPHISVVFQRLLDDRGAGDPVVDGIYAETPTAAQLLAVHLKPERARFAADVADEVRNVTILAIRFLTQNTSLADTAEVVFAIELLADRAIAAPGWMANPEPAPSLEDIATAAGIANAVSHSGGSVVMVALDHGKALVRVDSEAGKFSRAQRVPLTTFSGSALDEWKKEFPYGYANEDVANVFYLTTDALRFSPLPPSPVLVVASTILQCLPLNLWRIDNEFAGSNHAMVAVPSLSWLRAAQALKAVAGRKKLAWISTSTDQGHTLAMVADRLHDTLQDHDVELNSNSALPTNFTGEKFVVVTAHGGIAPGGKDYFARISDEGRISVNGEEFARCLRNVDVVVLFVCSGGRMDKNPSRETTSGMVKQLLDAGCSAVVASPWPLDPRVAYHWLPTFMNAWRHGADLAQATLEANKNVHSNFPGDFAKSLAMHCFGNPFVGYH